jgi:hypothetical protein
MDAARNYLFPLYASLLTPVWLRILGAKVGRNTEISTALLTPKFTVVEDGAFLADDTMVASYELGGGWIHVATATVGKRAFLGNSGITQPGRRVPDDGLVAVLSATPAKAKAGSSWLGSPPVRLRRNADQADLALTYNPPLRLKMMRGAVETCRLVPVMVTFAIGAATLAGLQALVLRGGYGLAALGGGVVLMIAGAVAGGSANIDGVLVLEVTRTSADSTPARIVRMTAAAQRQRRHELLSGERFVHLGLHPRLVVLGGNAGGQAGQRAGLVVHHHGNPLTFCQTALYRRQRIERRQHHRVLMGFDRVCRAHPARIDQHTAAPRGHSGREDQIAVARGCAVGTLGHRLSGGLVHSR